MRSCGKEILTACLVCSLKDLNTRCGKEVDAYAACLDWNGCVALIGAVLLRVCVPLCGSACCLTPDARHAHDRARLCACAALRESGQQSYWRLLTWFPKTPSQERARPLQNRTGSVGKGMPVLEAAEQLRY